MERKVYVEDPHTSITVTHASGLRRPSRDIVHSKACRCGGRRMGRAECSSPPIKRSQHTSHCDRCSCKAGRSGVRFMENARRPKSRGRTARVRSHSFMLSTIHPHCSICDMNRGRASSAAFSATSSMVPANTSIAASVEVFRLLNRANSASGMSTTIYLP